MSLNHYDVRNQYAIAILKKTLLKRIHYSVGFNKMFKKFQD
jgi:hypothetical protein